MGRRMLLSRRLRLQRVRRRPTGRTLDGDDVGAEPLRDWGLRPHAPARPPHRRASRGERSLGIRRPAVWGGEVDCCINAWYSPTLSRITGIMRTFWRRAGKFAWSSRAGSKGCNIAREILLVRSRPGIRLGCTRLTPCAAFPKAACARHGIRAAPAFPGKFPKESIIPYNLSCYACQLEMLDAARVWLEARGDPWWKRISPPASVAGSRSASALAWKSSNCAARIFLGGLGVICRAAAPKLREIRRFPALFFKLWIAWGQRVSKFPAH